jgi:hypothetical protein
MPRNELECRLKAQPEYLLGQEITIRFTLTNPTNYSVWILKWNTPLEGILSNHFRVTRDNQIVRYEASSLNEATLARINICALALEILFPALWISQPPTRSIKLASTTPALSCEFTM